MKKKIEITASYIFEAEDEWLDGQEFNTFDEIEDSDYDNVGRPLNHLTDVGWKITSKRIVE